jgi:hypothetical protein
MAPHFGIPSFLDEEWREAPGWFGMQAYQEDKSFRTFYPAVSP